jgi:hypothetical protein
MRERFLGFATAAKLHLCLSGILRSTYKLYWLSVFEIAQRYILERKALAEVSYRDCLKRRRKPWGSIQDQLARQPSFYYFYIKISTVPPEQAIAFAIERYDG